MCVNESDQSRTRHYLAVMPFSSQAIEHPFHRCTKMNRIFQDDDLIEVMIFHNHLVSSIFKIM